MTHLRLVDFEDEGPRRRNCPRPDKHAYVTKQDARRAVKQQRSTPGVVDARALVAYRCTCGAWHTGRRPIPSARVSEERTS